MIDRVWAEQLPDGNDYYIIEIDRKVEGDGRRVPACLARGRSTPTCVVRFNYSLKKFHLIPIKDAKAAAHLTINRQEATPNRGGTLSACDYLTSDYVSGRETCSSPDLKLRTLNLRSKTTSAYSAYLLRLYTDHSYPVGISQVIPY